MMAQVLQRLGHVHALVFTGPDGIDELGVAGFAHCWEMTTDGIRDFVLDPRDAGLDVAPLDAVLGGDAATNAAIILAVLDGEAGPRRDAVLLNTAAVLLAADHVTTLIDGVALAASSIDSGAARRTLDTFVRVSRGMAA